jgi:hypothetical protein
VLGTFSRGELLLIRLLTTAVLLVVGSVVVAILITRSKHSDSNPKVIVPSSIPQMMFFPDNAKNHNLASPFGQNLGTERESR